MALLEHADTGFTCLLGWTVFFVLLLTSFDVSLPKVSEKVDESIAGHNGTTSVLAFAHCALLVAQTWFNLVLTALVVYVLCAFLTMAAHRAMFEAVANLILFAASPKRVLSVLDGRHSAFHCAVAGVILVYAFVSTHAYLDRKSLKDPDSARAKSARVSLTCFALTVTAYVLYATYDLGRTSYDIVDGMF